MLGFSAAVVAVTGVHVIPMQRNADIRLGAVLGFSVAVVAMTGVQVIIWLRRREEPRRQKRVATKKPGVVTNSSPSPNSLARDNAVSLKPYVCARHSYSSGRIGPIPLTIFFFFLICLLAA